MSTIDTQLAELLGENAKLFAAYEGWANGQIMLLAGTADDPDSYNSAGGKTGELGFYPVQNVSGQTIYAPCLARLRRTALDAVDLRLPVPRLVVAPAIAAEGDTITAVPPVGGLTITLPADGGRVTIRDGGGVWSPDRSVTVNGNGRTIAGQASQVLDQPNFELVFQSDGTTWAVTAGIIIKD